MTVLAFATALTVSCANEKKESTNDVQHVGEDIVVSDIDTLAQAITADKECSQIKQLDEYDAQNRPIKYYSKMRQTIVKEVETTIDKFKIKHALFESYDKEDLIGPMIVSQKGRKFETEYFTEYCYGAVVTIILGYDDRPESLNDTIYISRSMLIDSLDVKIPENKRNTFFIYGCALDSVKSDSIFFSIGFGDYGIDDDHPVKLKLKKTETGTTISAEPAPVIDELANILADYWD